MGQTLVKEKLYSAIERSDDYTVRKIIEKYPQYINDAMTKDCQSTPLGRSAFRGDLKLCDLLLQLKADIDYSGPRKITPLMWAARRGQIIIVKFLVENGADVTLLCPDKFNVLEQSVLYGQYDIALYLITRIPKIAETLKPYETYENFVDLNRFRYVDYKNFIDHLLQKIPFSACPDFYTRPKPPPLKDPVQDPREPWKKWFSRVLEFGEPPMVERDELPENLQPQNRLMGKINCYLNGESPYPSNFYERQNYDNMIKSEAELQKNSNKGNQKQTDRLAVSTTEFVRPQQQFQQSQDDIEIESKSQLNKKKSQRKQLKKNMTTQPIQINNEQIDNSQDKEEQKEEQKNILQQDKQEKLSNESSEEEQIKQVSDQDQEDKIQQNEILQKNEQSKESLNQNYNEQNEKEIQKEEQQQNEQEQQQNQQD